jgi:hypothetical protein
MPTDNYSYMYMKETTIKVIDNLTNIYIYIYFAENAVVPATVFLCSPVAEFLKNCVGKAYAYRVSEMEFLDIF